MGRNKLQTSYFQAGGAMKILVLILLLPSATSTAAREMFQGQGETEKAIVHKQREMFVDMNVIMPDGNSPGTHHTIGAVDFCKQSTWCNERLSQP
ncbi:hypothetical protein MA16_Dca016525 [Dendrobium catenatum]|uniref:Uncharacterized protein n=1 Tax=Dendrobium catenatum TaxID=906689 RepID=A0A2I0X696_9ASPA|nr:hypothetical protein MA16_Dca016525 [Dendrobium catenatum]